MFSKFKLCSHYLCAYICTCIYKCCRWLNINRGRDHGFDSYVNYRRAYGLSVPNSWADLRLTHPEDVIQSLQSVYDDIRDVELYPAGECEPLPPIHSQTSWSGTKKPALSLLIRA